MFLKLKPHYIITLSIFLSFRAAAFAEKSEYMIIYGIYTGAFQTSYLLLGVNKAINVPGSSKVYRWGLRSLPETLF